MTSRKPLRFEFERASWLTLLATVAITPLAIAKVPFVARSVAVTVFAFPQSATLVIGVALSLALWAVALASGQTRFIHAFAMVPFAAFAMWAALSSFAGLDPAKSLMGDSLSSMSLMLVLAYCALGFLVTQLAHSPRRVVELTWTVISSASVVGLIALAQQLFHARVFDLELQDWVVSRGFATMGNPDHLGTFLVLPAALAVFVALTAKTRNSRVAARACSTVLVAAAVGTLTRGAWIALIAGGALTFALYLVKQTKNGQGSRPLGLLAALLLGIALSIAASDATDLASRFEVRPPPALQEPGALDAVNRVSSDRLRLWRSALDITRSDPLTGVGPASYTLGWYRVAPVEGGGAVAVTDDPHSLFLLVLATMGIPGFIVYAWGVVAVLVYSTRASLGLIKRGTLPTQGIHYLAWFIATLSLHVALLVGAVSSPIVMYAFLGYAMLMLPSLKHGESDRAQTFARLAAIGALLLAIGLPAALAPTLKSEIALARSLSGNDLNRARGIVESTGWNIDLAKQYYRLRVLRMNSAVDSGASTATEQVAVLDAELSRAGERAPHEYYYPSVRTQILARARERFPGSYAEETIAAADEALAIMPNSLFIRVNKALALSELGRFEEMAAALEGFWEHDLVSSYPGIIYAQALAYSDKPEQAEAVFLELVTRFPAEADTIDAIREETLAQVAP